MSGIDAASSAVGAAAPRPRGTQVEQPFLDAHGLSVGYGGKPALAGLDFTVMSGQRVGVIGPNGGGKTTLFRAILGELPPLAGTIEVRARCGVVPQTQRSRLDYPVTALDVSVMGTLSRLPWWRRPGRADRRRAMSALREVGAADLAARSFGELSGGQQQRVLIARALVQDARLVLLDEPFTGVDQANVDRLLALANDLASEGRALLIATHDIDQARTWDRVLCLNGRQIAFGSPQEVLVSAVLAETYTGSVLFLSHEGHDRAPQGPASR